MYLDQIAAWNQIWWDLLLLGGILTLAFNCLLTLTIEAAIKKMKNK